MIEKVPPEPGRELGPAPGRELGPESGQSGPEAPTWAAALTIKTRHTSLEARGRASVAAAVGIVGIFCATATTYIASHASPHAWPWFLGLAAAELAVAALTIIRITKPGRRRSL